MFLLLKGVSFEVREKLEQMFGDESIEESDKKIQGHSVNNRSLSLKFVSYFGAGGRDSLSHACKSVATKLKLNKLHEDDIDKNLIDTEISRMH